MGSEVCSLASALRALAPGMEGKDPTREIAARRVREEFSTRGPSLLRVAFPEVRLLAGTDARDWVDEAIQRALVVCMTTGAPCRGTTDVVAWSWSRRVLIREARRCFPQLSQSLPDAIDLRDGDIGIQELGELEEYLGDELISLLRSNRNHTRRRRGQRPNRGAAGSVGDALELCLEIAAGVSIRDQVSRHLGVRQRKVTSEEWKRAVDVMYKRRERARRRIARLLLRLHSQGRLSDHLLSRAAMLTNARDSGLDQEGEDRSVLSVP